MQQSSEYIRLAADLQSDSIVDGPGLRTVIWTQGCLHHCPYCQNPQTWSVDGGALVEINDVLSAIDELSGQDGITFSGGDPMYQAKACSIIAEYCKKKGYNIWVYTGFTFEEVMLLTKKDKTYLDFLNNIDILVDGKFQNELKDLSLLFRGSSNQRLIDVKKTLASNRIILFDEKEYSKEEEFLIREPMYI